MNEPKAEPLRQVIGAEQIQKRVKELARHISDDYQGQTIQALAVLENASMFKWSRENGGLAGRGTFNPGPNTLTITANLVAITTANQPGFYVEIEQWDPSLGHWQVVCGGNATSNNDTLTFTGAPGYGAYPAAQGDVFFRLWDGLASISAFPIQASPNQLENGIFLQFDADGPGLYQIGRAHV